MGNDNRKFQFSIYYFFFASVKNVLHNRIFFSFIKLFKENDKGKRLLIMYNFFDGRKKIIYNEKIENRFFFFFVCLTLSIFFLFSPI
jgi:hypothetical protein